MKRKFNFGKINYNGTGKRYPVTVSVELTERGGEPTFTIENGERVYTGKTTPKYYEFSAWGSIGARCGGQCLDTMAEYLKGNADFMKIYRLWKNYHLNGMNAGTPEQEAFINEYFNGRRYDYNEACEALKGAGLYEVPFYGKTTGREWNGEPYKYGHGWVINDIPADVLEEIKDLLTK